MEKMMRNEIIRCVEADEQHILDVFDDDLFAGHLNAEALSHYQNMDPITELDVVIDAAITRALNLSISDGTKLRPKVLQ